MLGKEFCVYHLIKNFFHSPFVVVAEEEPSGNASFHFIKIGVYLIAFLLCN